LSGRAPGVADLLPQVGRLVRQSHLSDEGRGAALGLSGLGAAVAWEAHDGWHGGEAEGGGQNDWEQLEGRGREVRRRQMRLSRSAEDWR
jgi:hypothetical protein